MVVELNAKSQITLPDEICKELNLSTGDLFEVSVQEGNILLTPVIVYPKKYRDDLRSEILKVKAQIASGKQPQFDSVEAMLDTLEDRITIDLPF